MVVDTRDMELTERERRALQTLVPLRGSFASWLEQNILIWRYFNLEADRLWRSGFRHYSARTIVHTIRHHTRLRETDGAAFKINNNYSPDMARLYLYLNPERTGFFATRGAPATVLKQAQQHDRSRAAG